MDGSCTLHPSTHLEQRPAQYAECRYVAVQAALITKSVHRPAICEKLVVGVEMLVGNSPADSFGDLVCPATGFTRVDRQSCGQAAKQNLGTFETGQCVRVESVYGAESNRSDVFVDGRNRRPQLSEPGVGVPISGQQLECIPVTAYGLERRARARVTRRQTLPSSR